MQAKTLVEPLADTVEEAEVERLKNTLGDVEMETLIEKIADTLLERKARTLLETEAKKLLYSLADTVGKADVGKLGQHWLTGKQRQSP